MNVTDLVDPLDVATLLNGIGWHVPVDDAEALAEEALDFESPPATAWTVLAHVAEHRGDYAGLERWTAAALGADLTSPFALADEAYLEGLAAGCGRKASPLRRAEHVFEKLERFIGRPPQLSAHLDLCADVLGVPVTAPSGRTLAVVESAGFVDHLAFGCGLFARFLEVAGDRLPASERALLESWRDLRHRHVRMIEQRRRRWTMVDLVTGERIVADTSIESWWDDDQEGLVLVAPVGGRSVVVGDAMSFPVAHPALRSAVLAEDWRNVAAIAVRSAAAADRRVRVAFCFPDVDPDEVPDDEEALLELVRSRRPAVADGDVNAEADLLLESIVAHRIITRRTIHTWELATGYLRMGCSREEALRIVTDLTYDELWERSRQDDAA